jgi:hypothetical protein
MSSARWDQPGIPHKGWLWVDINDLDEPIGTCGMCGQPNVRYMHQLEHCETGQTIEVGCVCAEKMTDDYLNPREREAAFISRRLQRARFPMRKGWRTSAKGNKFIRFDGHHVVVFRYGSHWAYRADGSPSDYAYETWDEAAKEAFDSAIDHGPRMAEGS